MQLELVQVFVPFLGDFFSIGNHDRVYSFGDRFSSPFSGIFFQCECGVLGQCGARCFRPLSRGLFFNYLRRQPLHAYLRRFSSPFSGTFFQLVTARYHSSLRPIVFVPFLGDFFSMNKERCAYNDVTGGFRPLSRGLFFNQHMEIRWLTGQNGFRPLSRGLFFNFPCHPCHRHPRRCVFVPFLGDFFSIFSTILSFEIPSLLFSSPFSGTFFQWSSGNH